MYYDFQSNDRGYNMERVRHHVGSLVRRMCYVAEADEEVKKTSKTDVEEEL